MVNKTTHGDAHSVQAKLKMSFNQQDLFYSKGEADFTSEVSRRPSIPQTDLRAQLCQMGQKKGKLRIISSAHVSRFKSADKCIPH